MKFIQPTVEWWPQNKTVTQHIARVGRICYKTEGKQPSAELSEEQREEFIEKRDQERVQGFWDSGHRSMLRHGTAYFYIKNQGKLPKWIWGFFSASDYIHYAVKQKQVWISTNMQFINEHSQLTSILEPFCVDEQEFIERALAADCKAAIMLLRMTLVVTTQISTSRELNRTSSNAIAEQSTRYVNMKNKGGVQICEPHWFSPAVNTKGELNSPLTPLKHRFARLVYRTAAKFSEWSYLLLLKLGLKPQDARGVLIIDSYTRVAYTYNLLDWSHILDLRYHGTTGTPHPNAYIAGEQISTLINDRIRQYIPNFSI